MANIDDLTKQLEQLKLDKGKASTQAKKNELQKEIDKVEAEMKELSKNNAGIKFELTEHK